MLGAQRERATRKGHVGGVGLHALCHESAAELLLAALDGHVHVGADGVGQGAHGGTLLGRDLAHGVHDGGQAALAAQDANAQGLQGVHVLGLGKALLDLSLNCLEVVGHRHCVLPFPNKNPSSGILCPRTDDFRGTTLVDERVFSRARPLLGPVPWGGRLPYWVARSAPAPAATVKVAAGGVNSGRQPWRDLSAGEPHLLSAGDATTKPLRHCLVGHGSTADALRKTRNAGQASASCAAWRNGHRLGGPPPARGDGHAHDAGRAGGDGSHERREGRRARRAPPGQRRR